MNFTHHVDLFPKATATMLLTNTTSIGPVLPKFYLDQVNQIIFSLRSMPMFADQLKCLCSSILQYELACYKMLFFLPKQGSHSPQFEAYKNYIKVTKQNTNNSGEVYFRIWQIFLAAIQKKVRFLTSLSLNTSWSTFLFQGIEIAFALLNQNSF